MAPSLFYISNVRSNRERKPMLKTFAAVLLLGITPVVAEPYILKCSTSDGTQISDLKVDLDGKTMTWGSSRRPNYIITNMTARYIYASKDREVMGIDVGGELLVLDRISGEYKRALLGSICGSNVGCLPHIEGDIFFGRCVRPIL